MAINKAKPVIPDVTEKKQADFESAVDGVPPAPPAPLKPTPEQLEARVQFLEEELTELSAHYDAATKQVAFLEAAVKAQQVTIRKMTNRMTPVPTEPKPA